MELLDREELVELEVFVVVGITTASQILSHERISVLSPFVVPRVTSIFSVARVLATCIVSGLVKFRIRVDPLALLHPQLNLVHHENQDELSSD